MPGCLLPLPCRFSFSIQPPHDSACLALLVPHKTVEMSKVKLHFISKIALGLLWSPKGKAHATSLWYVCRRRFRHGPLTIESYGSAPPPRGSKGGRPELAPQHAHIRPHHHTFHKRTQPISASHATLRRRALSDVPLHLMSVQRPRSRPAHRSCSPPAPGPGWALDENPLPALGLQEGRERCLLRAVQRHHVLGCATTTSVAVSFFSSRPIFSTSPGSKFPGSNLPGCLLPLPCRFSFSIPPPMTPLV